LRTETKSWMKYAATVTTILTVAAEDGAPAR
jgi:hypothetical protein